MTSTHRNLPPKAGLSWLEAGGALSPQQQLTKGAVMPQGNDLLCPASHHLPEHRLRFSVLCSQLWGLPPPSVSTQKNLFCHSCCVHMNTKWLWNTARPPWNKWFFIKFCKEVLHRRRCEDLGRSSHRGGSWVRWHWSLHLPQSQQQQPSASRFGKECTATLQ